MRGVKALLMVGWTGLWLSACRSPAPQLGEEADLHSCPHGAHADVARSQRVRTLLRGARASRELLARAPQPQKLCFSRSDILGVSPEGTMLLDDEAGEAETAARLGHLMVHLVEGFPPITPRSACEAWIARVVEAEVRAHVLELELRRELGVTDPRRSFPFERDYYRAAPNRRAAVVRDYFVAHPEGGPGVPGFISIYRARCENVSPKRLTSPRTSR